MKERRRGEYFEFRCCIDDRYSLFAVPYCQKQEFN